LRNRQDIYDSEYYKKLQKGYINHEPWVWKRIKVVLEYLDPSKEDLILETGCGQGTLAMELAKKCKKVVAIDYNLNAIRSAKEFISKFHNIELIQADLLNLPLKTESFDKINFSDVIEHLTHPQKVLHELNRVLSNDGLLALTTWPSISNIFWRFNYKIGLGSKQDFNPQTVQSVRRYLDEADFEILKMNTSYFYAGIFGTRLAINGCNQGNIIARFCEKYLTKGKLGYFLASSINVLAKKR